MRKRSRNEEKEEKEEKVVGDGPGKWRKKRRSKGEEAANKGLTIKNVTDNEVT